MEVTEEILLSSLANSGVQIPDSVDSFDDLTPEILFSVCSDALRLIDGRNYGSAFPASLPEDSMPERVKICTDLSSAFNSLGFEPELSFHKILYPSREDLYNLMKFLVGKLAGGAPRTSVEDVNIVQNELVLTRSEDQTMKTQNKNSSQEEVLKKPVELKLPDLYHLDEEQELLNAAVEMLSSGKHPVEFYVKQLSDQVEAKTHELEELEFEWNGVEKSLQEKKRDLIQHVSELYPEMNEKLPRMKDIDVETESILAEIKRREEELSKLSSDLEKQPKLAPRRSYIERVNEITKNSRKQDNDIQRILKDTRDLQLESNAVQERLNRTYAVVSESIFREGKKDPVGRQAYRLLTNIHESFEQIAEKILAADRSRRDAIDYEAKLSIINGRSFNKEKLEADIDSLKKENDLLEQRLHHS